MAFAPVTFGRCQHHGAVGVRFRYIEPLGKRTLACRARRQGLIFGPGPPRRRSGIATLKRDSTARSQGFCDVRKGALPIAGGDVLRDVSAHEHQVSLPIDVARVAEHPLHAARPRSRLCDIEHASVGVNADYRSPAGCKCDGQQPRATAKVNNSVGIAAIRKRPEVVMVRSVRIVAVIQSSEAMVRGGGHEPNVLDQLTGPGPNTAWGVGIPEWVAALRGLDRELHSRRVVADRATRVAV